MSILLQIIYILNLIGVVGQILYLDLDVVIININIFILKQMEINLSQISAFKHASIIERFT